MALAAKTVFVTGASRGIGLEFVKQLLRLKTAPEVVIAACRNPNSASDLQALAKSNPSLKLIKLDVEKDEEISKAVEETKSTLGERGLNLLINNAGIKVDKGSDLRQTTRESLQRHFNVNSTSPIIIVQKFLPLLEQAAILDDSSPMSCSKAAIINVSSAKGSHQLTLQHGDGTSFQYKCSKSAVTMATILMARELQEVGVLVMSLHPGRVRTAMGGGDAELTTEQSVAGCLNVISAQGEENNGKLMNYKGETLPF